METVLITAGPTREHLDEVRFLSNESSGRMGYAIAEAAVAAGHRTLLVSGPVPISAPAGVELSRVTSAQEMLERCLQLFESSDLAFGVAAVADLRPAKRRAGKPEKPAGPSSLELVPNPDVIAALAAAKGSRVVVGFALEVSGSDASDAALERGRRKLERKGLDLIVVNEPTALGAERTKVTLLFADGRQESWPEQHKSTIATRLLERALELWSDRNRTGEGAS